MFLQQDLEGWELPLQAYKMYVRISRAVISKQLTLIN